VPGQFHATPGPPGRREDLGLAVLLGMAVLRIIPVISGAC
jgi:hypothetical protein